jgi:hypothetical protein
MKCPDCSSSEIRASRTARWGDVFQRVLGREALRCKACRRRFFASNAAEPSSDKAAKSVRARGSGKLLSTRRKKRLARRLLVISIFAVAFAVFWFFLRYLTTERAPSQDSSVVTIHLMQSVS